jgi:hypothetical protein
MSTSEKNPFLESLLNELVTRLNVKENVNHLITYVSGFIESRLSDESLENERIIVGRLGEAFEIAKPDIMKIIDTLIDVLIQKGPEIFKAVFEAWMNVIKSAPFIGTLLNMDAAINKGLVASNIALSTSGEITKSIQGILDSLNETIKKMDSIQTTNLLPPSAAARALGGGRKTRRDKKRIERRISKSLSDFYNPLTIRTRKTRRSNTRRY